MKRLDLQPWQHLSTSTLFEHRWCTIVEDQVLLPSGQQIGWWRLAGGSSSDCVCIICCDPDQRILVAYQYNHPPGCVVDELPGGGVHDGEPPEDAARRELLEELGLYAGTLHKLGAFYTNNRRSPSRCHVFVATDLEQRQAAPEPPEVIAYEWVDQHIIDQRIVQGAIVNGHLLAAWSLFRSHRFAGM
jgi:ADP-ribose pyrophosphatase